MDYPPYGMNDPRPNSNLQTLSGCEGKMTVVAAGRIDPGAGGKLALKDTQYFSSSRRDVASQTHSPA